MTTSQVGGWSSSCSGGAGGRGAQGHGGPGDGGEPPEDPHPLPGQGAAAGGAGGAGVGGVSPGRLVGGVRVQAPGGRLAQDHRRGHSLLPAPPHRPHPRPHHCPPHLSHGNFSLLESSVEVKNHTIFSFD